MCDNENDENDNNVNNDKLPLILNGKFFCVKKREGFNVVAECCKCKKAIKGRVDATTNFRVHLKARNHSLEEFEQYRQSHFVHPKKRPLTSSNSEGSKKFKQTSILKHTHRNDQEQADDLITNFVIQTMSPLVIVEHDAFRKLVAGVNNLASPINVITRKTLSNKIDVRYLKILQTIKNDLTNVAYVCTTADIWSTSKRSYMGVTAHWIISTYERKSVALACRRFKGSHTHDKIRELINDIHCEFINKSKTQIVKTVTDNAANMIKAFSPENLANKVRHAVGSSRENPNSHNVLKDLLNDQSLAGTLEIEVKDLYNNSKVNSGFFLVESDENNDNSHNDEEDEVAIPISDILDCTDNDMPLDFFLPDHQRCISHTLNLITSTDIKSAYTQFPNSVYSKLHHSSFAKCTAIWNLTSRSPKAAESYTAITNTAPTSPCPTRWNSTFDCLQNILNHKDKFNEICVALELPKFRDTEVEFLLEYLEIVQPIAEAIDKLQGSHHTFYGELLPQLLRTRKLINNFQLRHIKYCSTLVSILLKSLDKRFGNYFTLSTTVNDAILATITHPFFKLRWAAKEKKNQLKQLLMSEIESLSKSSWCNVTVNKESPIATSRNLDEYFMFDESSSGSDAGTTNATKSNQFQLQGLQYLDDNRVDLPMLDQYPIIRELFFKYNTTIPSSAPVERLFSYAGMIMRPKRRCLTDAHLEKLLLLKANG